MRIPAIAERDFYVEREVAEQFGVSRTVISRWTAEGRLRPSVEIHGDTVLRKFLRTLVDALDKQTVPPVLPASAEAPNAAQATNPVTTADIERIASRVAEERVARAIDILEERAANSEAERLRRVVAKLLEAIWTGVDSPPLTVDEILGFAERPKQSD